MTEDCELKLTFSKSRA